MTGMLIAPAVLFFALTGVVQILGLHETQTGYTPPALVEKLGMLHKKQRFAEGRRSPPRAAHGVAANAPARAPDGQSRQPAIVLMKAFFIFVSLGLALSTMIGVVIALRHAMRRRLYLGLLVAGAVIPLVLALLTA